MSPVGKTKDAGWEIGVSRTVHQVTISATATGTRIGLHQERLADADERARQQQRWAAVMDGLVSLLDA